MTRVIHVSSLAACFCLGPAAPVPAAEPIPTGPVNGPPLSEANASATMPAGKCLGDLRAFDGEMQKDGYWLGGAGNSYGYPMDSPGYGYRMGDAPAAITGYRNARPGYQVRILLAAANILARNGQQETCEGVLATTREAYKLYVAGLQSENTSRLDLTSWRQSQIAAAQSVAGANSSFRSAELLGADVRSPKDEALGSVEDVVISPQTGKIAYLVVARGGIFGIDEKYTPVPWANFKVTPTVNMLVLDTTKGTMDAAPQVARDQFATTGRFDQESLKVDAYWKAHLTAKTGN